MIIIIVSKNVKVKWNPRNKRHYTDIGYQFTKIGDEFVVDVNDLTVGSQASIILRCDYCGSEYSIPWYQYVGMKRKEIIHKDACKKCCELKAKDSIVNKFGSYTCMAIKAEKRREETNIKRYGSPNVFSNEDIKNKIIKTNIKKYGVKYNQQSKNIRAKTVATVRERYGVDNYVELFKGKFIGSNSPVWNNDTEYIRQERSSNEYKKWRSCVFTKDNYTCQCCGAKSKAGKHVILNAHHIANWKDNPTIRYDVSNGVTLCEQCHMKFHQLYGKKNNNKNQLDEFIETKDCLDKKIC